MELSPAIKDIQCLDSRSTAPVRFSDPCPCCGNKKRVCISDQNATIKVRVLQEDDPKSISNSAAQSVYSRSLSAPTAYNGVGADKKIEFVSDCFTRWNSFPKSSADNSISWDYTEKEIIGDDIKTLMMNPTTPLLDEESARVKWKKVSDRLLEKGKMFNDNINSDNKNPNMTVQEESSPTTVGGRSIHINCACGKSCAIFF